MMSTALSHHAAIFAPVVPLRMAAAAGIFLGPLHLFPEFPGFPGVLLPLAVQPVSLLHSLFQRLPLGLQLGQHVLKPNAVLAHLRLGVGDNFIGQAQPPRDGKGIGRPISVYEF